MACGKNLRVIRTEPSDGAYNMAVDEALLKSRLPVLRLYSWRPACLSLGYFQSIRDIDAEAAKKHGIGIVRRITGGKAVLHDIELTYSFIIDEEEMPRQVTESYKIICRPILSALSNIGIRADMVEERCQHGSMPAICFTEPSYFEVACGGRKIVGSAQKRINRKILQHGSILIDVDFGKLADVFFSDDKEKTIEMLKRRVTSIKDQAGAEIGIDELARGLEIEFSKALGFNRCKSELSKDEILYSKRLSYEKYSTKQWNFMR